MKQNQKPALNNLDFVSPEQKAKSIGMNDSPKTENSAKKTTVIKFEISGKTEIVEKIVRLAKKTRTQKAA